MDAASGGQVLPLGLAPKKRTMGHYPKADADEISRVAGVEVGVSPIIQRLTSEI